MKNLSTKVDSDTYDEFIDSCNNSGSTASEKIRELVEYYNENGDPDEQEPQIEYRDKEVIKEVFKEVPKIEYRDKEVIKYVNIPQIQYVNRYIEKPKPTTSDHLHGYTCSEKKIKCTDSDVCCSLENHCE